MEEIREIAALVNAALGDDEGEFHITPSEARQALNQIMHLQAIIVDLVVDLASTSASHDEVYYTWEGIVRRADGMVADIIRQVSAEDDEWTWDRQLP